MEEAAVERPRSLSGAYLLQALDALHAAGDPDALYGTRRRHRNPSKVATALRVVEAHRRHHASLRTAVLFAALAAEGYVNELLAARIPERTIRKDVDGMGTVMKYKRGTFMATGETLFPDGREVTVAIEELFELRHALVHPKPGIGPAGLTELPGEFEAQFAPAKVAHYIVMVAGAAQMLVRRAYGQRELDVPGDWIWLGREALYGSAARLGSLPDPHSEPEAPLFQQAREAIRARRERAPRPGPHGP